MRRFFDPFLFEDVPAADRRADEVYLGEVARCDLYVGVLGDDYGFEDGEGVSATEREFTEATRLPTRSEIPPEVIREAIVNALAHRDYAQPGAVQVSVFADRVEVWSPGGLLPPLTVAQLRKPHRSLTRNARVCEVLYLAGYVEKFGTGTLMMIRESVEHALPEPDFAQTPWEFVATLWRTG